MTNCFAPSTENSGGVADVEDDNIRPSNEDSKCCGSGIETFLSTQTNEVIINLNASVFYGGYDIAHVKRVTA